MNSDNARRIGGYIESFVQAEDQDCTGRIRKYLRVQVEVNVNDPLKVGCNIVEKMADHHGLAFGTKGFQTFVTGVGG